MGGMVGSPFCCEQVKLCKAREPRFLGRRRKSNTIAVHTKKWTVMVLFLSLLRLAFFTIFTMFFLEESHFLTV